MIDALPVTEIVVTAERAPQTADETPASVSLIDLENIERLGEPLLPALLRITPSLAVTTSGPAGSLTEVRIRGAENNHTLLFIDGIRVNDPATGNQPRYELLNADIASRVEVVRGPQSALWGSEAIGGVISVNGSDDRRETSASVEAGSFGFRRAALSGSTASERGSLAFAGGWQRARGIDSFDGSGDRDGYRNLSGRARATWRVTPALRLGFAAVALNGRNDYDGYRQVFPYDHTDTLDSTRNRMLAGRAWAEFGSGDDWSGRLGVSLLGSRNVNFLDRHEINRTSGKRRAVDAQLQRTLVTGTLKHRVILALDSEGEEFRARDTIYFGSTNQDQDRNHRAITAEWRLDARPIATDIAIRRDLFNRFKDQTTVRASAIADLGGGFAVAAAYGEGIAQPTFFDLYGFSPASFVGNPSLSPESSRGVEASVRYRRGAVSGAVTLYRQRLRDEIVGTFDNDTFLSSAVNSEGVSRRSGVELEGGWAIADRLRLTANYNYLQADEPGSLPGVHVKESRRPKHSGSVAADGQIGRFGYGVSVAYTGDRPDTDFDVFPAQRVTLDSYWLAGARISYQLSPQIQLFARSANAFNAKYQDAIGYRTEPRSIYAGIRIAPRG